MRKDEPSRVEALEALLAERRKHEGYLAKLEERRAGTPDAVYAKLRDEYLTKLTDVQVRAAIEAEALSGGMEEDEAAVAEAQERLAALEAEKVEGELRAAVGEFDNKEWTKKLTALKANIMMAERERDARLEVFERARTLIDEAKSGGPGDDGSSPSAPRPASAPQTKTRPTSAITSGPSFDELAFLNSVAGRASSPGVPAPPAGRSSKPVEQVKDDGADGARDGARDVETAPKPKGTPAKAAPAVPAAAASSPSTSAAEAPVREGPSAEPPSARSAAPTGPVDEEQNAFGKPTPRTSQAVKTLKCQECGTFNYPTEWYCERCGGELAAL
jgi:hypothetical protein